MSGTVTVLADGLAIVDRAEHGGSICVPMTAHGYAEPTVSGTAVLGESGSVVGTTVLIAFEALYVALRHEYTAFDATEAQGVVNGVLAIVQK
jgi:hypothetical protein